MKNMFLNNGIPLFNILIRSETKYSLQNANILPCGRML